MKITDTAIEAAAKALLRFARPSHAGWDEWAEDGKTYWKEEALTVLLAAQTTISTAEELDALPVNTAIIGTSREPKHWAGTPYVKLKNGEWYDYGNEYSVESEDVILPATITFAPEEAV